MPISAMGSYSQEHWAEMREILVECIESISEETFSVRLVSEADEVGVIQRTIVQNLYKADIVICDVSGKNPNVMFELGMRLAFDKPTVIIKDDQTEYTFDTGVIEHLTYPRDHRFSKMRVFAANLKEKVLATYRASKEDPGHSTFLKNFGNFITPSLADRRSHESDLSAVMSLLNVVIQNQTKEIGRELEVQSNPKFLQSLVVASSWKEDFVTFYQPIVDLSGKITGLEALVRKKTKAGEFELPETFLPHLQNTDLMTDLQIWIIKSVSTHVENWRRNGYIVPRITINLSGQYVIHENIYEQLQSLSKSNQGQVEIDLPEDTLVNDFDLALSQINRLKKLALSIAINDFGTSYSSLAYLRRFPIDCIKIHRSFISKILTDENDQAIARAIITMAQHLDTRVVAVGVETQDQVSLLRSLGCDEIQGFLFGQPMPADEILKLLQK